MEISELPDNEFKLRVIKAAGWHQEGSTGKKIESFNSNRKCKYQTEITKLKNTIIKLKNSTEGVNERQAHVKDGISKRKDSAVEFDRRRRKQGRRKVKTD